MKRLPARLDRAEASFRYGAPVSADECARAEQRLCERLVARFTAVDQGRAAPSFDPDELLRDADTMQRWRIQRRRWADAASNGARDTLPLKFARWETGNRDAVRTIAQRQGVDAQDR